MITKPVKNSALLKTLQPNEPSTFHEVLMQEFRASADVAAIRAVNLETIGNTSLPGMPKSLRVECHLDDISASSGEQLFTMEFLDGDKIFGAITASMRLADNKIWLYDMVYKANIKGFAPYAIRQFVDTFRDIKQVVLATGVMADPEKCKRVKPDEIEGQQKAEHGKLGHFNRLGFQLIEEATQQRMGMPESHKYIRGCRAVFPFDDSETRAKVFANLNMQSDAGHSSQDRNLLLGRRTTLPPYPIWHQSYNKPA